MAKVSKIHCSTSSSVFGFGPDQQSKITLSKEAILLVLIAQSNHEENGCQGKHEQAMQNVVMIHLASSAALHNYPIEQQATQNS